MAPGSPSASASPRIRVTLLALAAALASAIAIGTGTRSGFVIGVALAHLFFWLDHVDGQVARWSRSSSLNGVYFDYLMHHGVALTQGFALGYGLAVRVRAIRAGQLPDSRSPRAAPF